MMEAEIANETASSRVVSQMATGQPQWGNLGTRWLVRTSSGSLHLFTFSEGTTYTRVPDADRATPADLPEDEMYSIRLRRDGETLPVLTDPLPAPVLGQRFEFGLGALTDEPGYIGTIRSTTPVVEMSVQAAMPKGAKTRQIDKELHSG